MRRDGHILILILIFISSLTSCREDLCYGHNHGKGVNFYTDYNLTWYIPFDNYNSEEAIKDEYNVNWSLVNPVEPAGVKATLFPWDKTQSKIIKNLSSKGGTVLVNYGIYDALIYNNDTEFIQFYDLDRAEYSSATTRSRAFGIFSSSDSLGSLVNQPDMLYAVSIDSIKIEKDEGLHSRYRAEEQELYDMNVTLNPLVYTYIVRCNVESGIEYITVPKGTLSAMAGTVMMKDGKTLDDMVTLAFDEAYKDSKGFTAYIKSFGMCNFDPSFNDIKSRGYYSGRGVSRGTEGEIARGERPRAEGNEKNILTLTLALTSKKSKIIEIDVSDQLLCQPRGGVIVVNGIKITPEEGQGEGGSFGVDINDWNEENIYIPM